MIGARAFWSSIALGGGVVLLALALVGCQVPPGGAGNDANGGTVTLPNIGGQICYDVKFDGGNGNGRVCMELAPGPNGPELVGEPLTAPAE